MAAPKTKEELEKIVDDLWDHSYAEYARHRDSTDWTYRQYSADIAQVLAVLVTDKLRRLEK